MKKIVFLALLISTLVAYGQQKSSVETRALAREFSRTKSADALSKRLTDQLPLRYDAQGASIGVLAKVSPAFRKGDLEQQGIKVTSQVADIVSLRVPLNKLRVLESCQEILQYSVSHRAAPFCDATRADTHADSVQQGLGNLPQAFNGEGVLVGITDWGFDYLHPNINPSANPRILRAWDQFKLSGPAPTGFDYGTEFSSYAEMQAVRGDTSNIYDYNSHGTHVAGIIGGIGTKSNGNGKYKGMAPKVQYLMGSWLLDEASWLDEVAWMYGISKTEGKRLVINSSWGMYSFSTLDGSSLLSQAINHYSDSGIVFVTSAGNNGTPNCHLQMDFSSRDTLGSVASYFSNEGGQMLIYWGLPGQTFQAGFAMSANNSTIVPGGFFATSDNIDYYENYVVIEGDTVHYSVMTESSNPFDQRPHVLLKVDRVGQYKLHALCAADSGTQVHLFNINYLNAHESNCGAALSNGGFPGYLNGDKGYGIGEPGCAEKTITVAAHSAGRWKNDSTYIEGTIASFSSYGPTLDGRNKPEISAPGVNVVSSVNSRDVSARENLAVILSGGIPYKFASMSGTSMSGPAVSGIVALMLQANPHLTTDQVREILFRTALNDNETGDLHAQDSVSPRWGYGKIDAMRAVCAALDQLSISEAVSREIPLTLYPNPANDRFVVQTGSNLPAKLTVFGVNGRKIMERTIETETTISTHGWAHGVYIVRVQDRTGIRTCNVVH